MKSLTGRLRAWVRKEDVTAAKEAYKAIVAPGFRFFGIPLYDITSSSTAGYTWFRIPKNGTHSIMSVLPPPDVNSSFVPYFRKEHRTRFKFCFIRNPWDRLVSVYSNKVGMRLMFPECWDRDFSYFIDFVSRQNLHTCDNHLRLQTALFPVAEIDFVGRMENFDADLKVVCERLGIPGRTPHLGSVDHPDYRTFYTDHLRERAGEMYRQDIEFGQYEF